MSKVNQSGIAQLAIILLLLAGVGLGTYLVQTKTNIFPQACELDSEGQCSGGSEGSDNKDGDGQEEKSPSDTQRANELRRDERSNSSGGCPEWAVPVDGGCKDTRLDDGSPKNPSQGGASEDTNGLNPSEGKTDSLKNCDAIEKSDSARTACESENQKTTAKNNETCAKDQVTYCQGGEAIRKTGGYFDTKEGKCVFAFYEVNEKDSQCRGASDGNVVKEDPREAAARDELYAIQQRSVDADNKCQSVTYCEADGTLTRKLSQAPNGEGGCIETFQKIEDSSSCKGKDGKNLAAGTVIDKGDETKRAYQVYGRKVQIGELNTIIGDAEKGLDKIADADMKAKVTQALEDAKKLLTRANEVAEACKDNASCAVSDAAQTEAVAKSRLALAEAIKAGVPGVTVKMDLQIGQLATNSPISAKPSIGDGINRVFARSRLDEATGKVVVDYLVRNTAGQLVLADIDDLNKRNSKAGLTFSQGQNIEQFGSFIGTRITKLNEDLTKGVTNPSSDTGRQVNQPPAGQPAAQPAQPVAPPQNTTEKKTKGASCQRGIECQSGFCNPISPGARTGTCSDSPATNRL